MQDCSDNSYPSDICLLLRAHGEHRWLSSELLPVLRELNQPERIPEDQLGAALAYLELLWLEARRRAADTEAAFAELAASDPDGDRLLHAEARQYHASVRALRDVVSRHVARLTAFPRMAPTDDASVADATHEHA